jgi:hypothetical protein
VSYTPLQPPLDSNRSSLCPCVNRETSTVSPLLLATLIPTALRANILHSTVTLIPGDGARNSFQPLCHAHAQPRRRRRSRVLDELTSLLSLYRNRTRDLRVDQGHLLHRQGSSCPPYGSSFGAFERARWSSHSRSLLLLNRSPSAGRRSMLPPLSLRESLPSPPTPSLPSRRTPLLSRVLSLLPVRLRFFRCSPFASPPPPLLPLANVWLDDDQQSERATSPST